MIENYASVYHCHKGFVKFVIITEVVFIAQPCLCPKCLKVCQNFVEANSKSFCEYSLNTYYTVVFESVTPGLTKHKRQPHSAWWLPVSSGGFSNFLQTLQVLSHHNSKQLPPHWRLWTLPTESLWIHSNSLNCIHFSRLCLFFASYSLSCWC